RVGAWRLVPHPCPPPEGEGEIQAQGFLAGAAGAISAEGGFTLGAFAAVPLGECAPAVSRGFWSGGLYANGPGSTHGGGGFEATGVPEAAGCAAEAAGATAGAAGFASVDADLPPVFM